MSLGIRSDAVMLIAAWKHAPVVDLEEDPDVVRAHGVGLQICRSWLRLSTLQGAGGNTQDDVMNRSLRVIFGLGQIGTRITRGAGRWRARRRSWPRRGGMEVDSSIAATVSDGTKRDADALLEDDRRRVADALDRIARRVAELRGAEKPTSGEPPSGQIELAALDPASPLHPPAIRAELGREAIELVRYLLAAESHVFAYRSLVRLGMIVAEELSRPPRRSCTAARCSICASTERSRRWARATAPRSA